MSPSALSGPCCAMRRGRRPHDPAPALAPPALPALAVFRIGRITMRFLAVAGRHRRLGMALGGRRSRRVIQQRYSSLECCCSRLVAWSDHTAWSDLVLRPTALMGFDPSQLCSDPRVFGHPSDSSHMPFSLTPASSLFLCSRGIDRRVRFCASRSIRGLDRGCWAFPRISRTRPMHRTGPLLPWASPLPGLRASRPPLALARRRRADRVY